MRAYIVRSLWAIQAVLTSVRAQDLRLPLLPRDTLFAAERADRVQGWSRVDDVLYPMTLGFALLENWVELWHNYREYREARRKHRDEWETVDLDDFDTVEGGVCVGADAHDSFSHIGESKDNGDLQTVPASPKTTTRNHASVPLPSTSQTRTRPPPPPPAYNPSLLIHHLLFFLVEFHTFRTRSLAYFGNILKFWEATAPISFAVWVSQRRKAWRDAEKKAVADVQGRAATPDPLSVETCSDSDGDGTASTRSRRGSTSSSRSTHSSQSNASIDATRLVTTAAATTTTTTTAPRHNLPFTIGSQRTLRHLTLLRIIIWILVRTVFDAHFLRQLYRDGLLPWGRNAHRLNFGNKVQLWLAAPVFWYVVIVVEVGGCNALVR